MYGESLGQEGESGQRGREGPGTHWLVFMLEKRAHTLPLLCVQCWVPARWGATTAACLRKTPLIAIRQPK
jgi:hypothetical protein